jgi:ABC-type Mn2+/Zn2+ transport system ATPase subunit
MRSAEAADSQVEPASAIAPGQPTASVAVRMVDVSSGYDRSPAIEHVSFSLPSGTLTAIVGPNGGGKSTLLKVIAGLLPPWSGSVEVLGEPPGGRASAVAYVPQAEAVDWAFPVSAGDVVMMGRYARLGILHRPGRKDQEQVDAALEAVGMRGLRDRQIGALSGGQRRRVFLARAIAAEPELYLLDEPVTGVDATTEHDLAQLLEGEAQRGKTVVATTHDLASAAGHFTRLLAINRTLVADGDASLIFNEDVLSRTYGGHLMYVGNRMALIDDAHHHDQEAPGETPHHHDSDRHRHGPG